MELAVHPYLYQSEPESDLAEAIRTLRAFVLQHRRKNGTRSWLITSCWPGEGKTALCLNLAAAVAEFGLTVALVDADLRTQGLLRMFSRHPIAGLSVRQPPMAPEAAHSLTRPDFLEGVRQASMTHDLTLTDTPSLSVCRDAYLARAWVDGALMVVDRRRFRGVAEGVFAEDLRVAGIPVLGTVLTG